MAFGWSKRRASGGAWQTEKERLSKLSSDAWEARLEKKNADRLKDVPTWLAYFKLVMKGRRHKEAAIPANDEEVRLSRKVSIYRGDITKLGVDAIVNAANNRMLGGGGVDGAIHRAAGDLLYEECLTAKGCPTGEAKITGAYKLPAKSVIHTVGPMGEYEEELESCYRRSLEVLVKNRFRTIAFPCISTGVYGYPNESACQVALATVKSFLLEHPDKIDRVVFCLFLQKDVDIYEWEMLKYFPIPAPKPKVKAPEKEEEGSKGSKEEISNEDGKPSAEKEVGAGGDKKEQSEEKNTSNAVSTTPVKDAATLEENKNPSKNEASKPEESNMSITEDKKEEEEPMSQDMNMSHEDVNKTQEMEDDNKAGDDAMKMSDESPPKKKEEAQSSNL